MCVEYPYQQPIKRNKMTNLRLLYVLWHELSNIPTKYDGDDVDCIEESFVHFPIGTHRETIWHWFESQNEFFIVGEVMNNIYVNLTNNSDIHDEIERAIKLSYLLESYNEQSAQQCADWIAQDINSVKFIAWLLNYYDDCAEKAELYDLIS